MTSVQTVHVIVLPAETLGRKHTHAKVSPGNQVSQTAVSAGGKTSRTVSAAAKYDGQSRQGAKIGGLVYTL